MSLNAAKCWVGVMECVKVKVGLHPEPPNFFAVCGRNGQTAGELQVTLHGMLTDGNLICEHHREQIRG